MKTMRKERDPKVSVKKIPLTKAAMITKMQLTEAAMFLELKKAEQEHGRDSRWTAMLRSQWSTVNQLMENLGIPADYQAPDNAAATAIIMERIRQQEQA
jgi:hypothetical protein